MIPNRHVRHLLGILLGGLAGFSFTVSVFPYALGLSDFRNVRLITQAVAGVWPWTAVLWAVGGWSVARACARGGGTAAGGMILGLVGAGSGLLLAAVRIGFAGWPVCMGLLGGLLYGLAGGWILGRILVLPAAKE